MDGLSGLLDGPRARRAFLLRILLDPPWCVRLEDGAPLSVTTVVRGHLWVCPDGGDEPARLDAGDVVVWVGGEHWSIADDPRTPTQVVIGPDQVCRTVDGHVVVEEMAQGVRSWGNSSEGETVLLTGVYQLEGEVTRRLLRSLPRTMVLRAGTYRYQAGAGLVADSKPEMEHAEVVAKSGALLAALRLAGEGL